MLEGRTEKAVGVKVPGLRQYLKASGDSLYVELYDPDDLPSANDGKDGLALIAKVIRPPDKFRYVCINTPYPRQVWTYEDDKTISHWGQIIFIEGERHTVKSEEE